MSLDVGSTYTATLTVTDPTAVTTNNPTGLVNPATATLTVTRPDQTTTTVPITLPPAQTGILLGPYVLDQEGLTKFAWAITGPTQSKTNYVNARAYRAAVSLEAAQEHLGVADPAKAEKIRILMAAATRYAEGIVGTLVPRTFTGDWVPGEFAPVLKLPHGPALNTSAVTQVRSCYPNGPVWAANQLIVNVRPGTVRTTSLLNFWYGPWLVDYTGGVTVVHDDIELGILEIVRDLYTPARGLSVDIAEQASEGLALPPYYHAPARAQMLLETHALPGFG